MSSTNRGAQRKDYDKYFTPDWLIEAFFDNYSKDFGALPRASFKQIYEPSCGSGAIVKVMRRRFPKSMIWYSDIVPEPEFDCPAIDFLEAAPTPEYDLVITNPPYNVAKEFAQHGVKFLNDKSSSRLVLLLRINFFGGQRRAGWLIENMPDSVYVTPRRPKFTGKGTDSTEYAWFVWKKEPSTNPSKIYVMDTRTDRFKK